MYVKSCFVYLEGALGVVLHHAHGGVEEGLRRVLQDGGQGALRGKEKLSRVRS